MRKTKQTHIGFFTILLLAILMTGTISVFAADNLTVDVEVTYDQSGARSMLSMVNSFRSGSDAWYWNPDGSTKTTLNGTLTPFVYDYDLEKAAMQRAAEIAVNYSHTRPNGTSCGTVISGWTSRAENIAAGYGSAAAVFDGWKEESEKYAGQGHRRNMLSDTCTAIGIGHVIYNSDHYWVQLFRAPAGSGAETAAVNGSKRCAVEIAKNKIADLALAQEDVKVEYGGSIAMPDAPFTLKMDEFWGNYGPGKIYPDTSWTMADPSIAVIQSGRILGKKAGTTTCDTSYYDPATKTDKKYSFKVEVLPVSLKDKGASISGAKEATYTGSAITYALTVACNGKTLVSGTDYTTEYSGNTDAGQASITVTGKGNYKDSVSASFKIKPKTLTAPMLTKKAADVTYTGEEQKPSVEMKDGSTALQEGKDYTISYRNHMNAGTAAYTITGKGNYQGSVEGQFTISPRAITGVVIESIPEQTFTGSEITPLPVVKDGSKTLVNGTDYDVSYKDNVNAGTATVTVTGKGNYTGSKDAVFEIKSIPPDNQAGDNGNQPGNNPGAESPSTEAPAPTQPSTETTIQEPITIPKTPASAKTKVKKNKVTVTWKNIKKTKKTKTLIGKIKYIQIQYSTDKAFRKNAVKKKVGKNKTKATYTLKKNTTYYIRMRYVGKDGVSKWTKAKKVKTKK